MTEELYAEALTQIAADHARLERVRRLAEGLLYNPAGSQLRTLGEELAEAIGMDLPADEFIDRQVGL